MSFSRDFIRNLPGLDPRVLAELDRRMGETAPSTPPPAPECSEKEFQARVIAYAQERGWLVYHTYDSRKSKAGFPDLVMGRPPAMGADWTRHGRVLFAELKSETGKERKEQREWRAMLESIAIPGVLGVPIEIYLWRPSDWAKIEEILK